MSVIDRTYNAPKIISQFMRSDAFMRLIKGPIGSGKSVGCCMEIVRKCKDMPPGPDGMRRSRWAIIRNTQPQLRDTTLKTWLEWFPAGVAGRWKETEKIFYLEFGDVRAEILFRPLDSPEDVQRVLSLELTGAWLNEAREIPKEIVEALHGRLRRYPSRDTIKEYWSGMICDTNPPEIESYWYKLLEHLPVEDKNPNSIMELDSFHQPSGLEEDADNKENLHPTYYDDLARGKTKEWVSVYIKGLYAKSQAGKPVYTEQFQYDRHVSRVSLPLLVDWPVLVGLDFGRTPVAVFMQIQPDGRLFILRDAAMFGVGLDTLIRMSIRPMLRREFPGNPVVFIGDPSGVTQNDTDDNTCFKLLRKEFPTSLPPGHFVKAAVTNDPIVRINALGEPFTAFPSGDPLIQIDPQCKWLIEGLRSKYRYARLKNVHGEVYKDTPEKNDWSHVVEACQYGALFALGKYDPPRFMHVVQHPFMAEQAYRPSDTYTGY